MQNKRHTPAHLEQRDCSPDLQQPVAGLPPSHGRLQPDGAPPEPAVLAALYTSPPSRLHHRCSSGPTHARSLSKQPLELLSGLPTSPRSLESDCSATDAIEAVTLYNCPPSRLEHHGCSMLLEVVGAGEVSE